MDILEKYPIKHIQWSETMPAPKSVCSAEVIRNRSKADPRVMNLRVSGQHQPRCYSLHLRVSIQNLGSTILMVTYMMSFLPATQPYSLLRDGKIYMEIYKGKRTSRGIFFEKILGVLAMMGRGPERWLLKYPGNKGHTLFIEITMDKH